MVSPTALLIPLFGVVVVGALVRSLGIFDAEDARRMSRFVFLVAMPLAAFGFTRNTEIDQAILIGLGGGYLMALSIMTALAFVIARYSLHLTVRETGAAVFSATCGNAIFVGVPIALAIEGWGSPFLILVILEGTLVFAIGNALMTWPEQTADPARGDNRAQHLKFGLIAGDAVARAIRSPAVIGLLLGLTAGSVGVPMAQPLADFFDIFTHVSGPVGLFVLGVSAADLVLSGNATKLSGAARLLPIKLLLFPALTASFVWMLTRDLLTTTVAAFFTGLPPSVSSIVLANVYGQWTRGVAGIVTVGTLIGLVSISAYLIIVLPS